LSSVSSVRYDVQERWNGEESNRYVSNDKGKNLRGNGYVDTRICCALICGESELSTYILQLANMTQASLAESHVCNM